MPCWNCGAGDVGIAGLSGPYLSTPDRRFRADSAFCLRWTLAAQSRQYFARPERVRKPLPQTSQRCSCLGLKMPRSSFGCSGSTAWRNQRQIRLRETACGQTPSSSRQSPCEKLQQRFASPRTLRACPGVRRKSVPSGRRSMGSNLAIGILLCNQLRVRWGVGGELTECFH